MNYLTKERESLHCVINYYSYLFNYLRIWPWNLDRKYFICRYRRPPRLERCGEVSENILQPWEENEGDKRVIISEILDISCGRSNSQGAVVLVA